VSENLRNAFQALTTSENVPPLEDVLALGGAVCNAGLYHYLAENAPDGKGAAKYAWQLAHVASLYHHLPEQQTVRDDAGHVDRILKDIDGRRDYWRPVRQSLTDLEAQLLAEWGRQNPAPAGEGDCDDAMFLPVMQLERLWESRFTSYKTFRAALDKSKVRTRRPLTATGEENSQRLKVHVGDLIAWLQALPRVSKKGVDVDNLPSAEADRLIGMLASRDAEFAKIQQQKKRERGAVG
jgi:hypothetical protein